MTIYGITGNITHPSTILIHDADTKQLIKSKTLVSGGIFSEAIGTFQQTVNVTAIPTNNSYQAITYHNVLSEIGDF